MDYWLYKEIISEDSERAPQQALQSTINWARSLAFEIVEEHGCSEKQQYDSCLNLFRGNTRGNGNTLGRQAVFEPLFYALIHTLSVVSDAIDEAPGPRAWSIPRVIVSWYYAFYTAIRSIIAASGIDAPETHAGVIKTVGASLRTKLPHPLNMHAHWSTNEDFIKELPNYPGVNSSNLTSAFPSTRQSAQEMLLGYLSGTTKREVGKIKKGLQKKHKLRNFRSKQARSLRDQAIGNKVYNFMHCAFRYRGKANYRDAIYISYGSRELWHRDEFLRALATSSKFIFVCALAFARVRLGQDLSQKFLTDLHSNLRDIDTARPEELFWKNILD